MRGVPRAFGKAVWTWPPVIAADAGTMQIQMWEGAVLGCTETVPRSTTPDRTGQSVDYGDKVS